MGMKLLAAASGRSSVQAGEILTCKVDLAMFHDSSGPRRLKPMLEALGTGPGWVLYQLNPLTPAIELFHWCFWAPTNGVDYVAPPGMPVFALLAGVTSLLALVVGEMVFRRLDGRFAQEL